MIVAISFQNSTCLDMPIRQGSANLTAQIFRRKHCARDVATNPGLCGCVSSCACLDAQTATGTVSLTLPGKQLELELTLQRIASFASFWLLLATAALLGNAATHVV